LLVAVGKGNRNLVARMHPMVEEILSREKESLKVVLEATRNLQSNSKYHKDKEALKIPIADIERGR